MAKPLRRNILDAAKVKRMRGVVFDVMSNQVSVRVAGRIIRGATMVGGPAQVGDEVTVEINAGARPTAYLVARDWSDLANGNRVVIASGSTMTDPDVGTAQTSGGSGDMTKATYDTDEDGKVESADSADALANLPADSSKFYSGAGTWLVPGGSGVDPAKILLVKAADRSVTQFDFTTAGLAAAIAAAATGSASSRDLIQLPQGKLTYSGASGVALNKCVLLRGSGPDTTVLEFTSQYAFFNWTVADVAVEDLTITKTYGIAGNIYTCDAGGRTGFLRNCRVLCYNSNFSGYGFALYNGQNVSHWNCYFKGSGSYGPFGTSSFGPNVAYGGNGYNYTLENFTTAAYALNYFLRPLPRRLDWRGGMPGDAPAFSNPPTDAQITAAMNGVTAASAGIGYVALLGSDTGFEYLVWSDGIKWCCVRGSLAGGVPTTNSQAVFTLPGTLAVGLDPVRICNSTGRTLTINKVTAMVDTPPVGAALLIDVHKNGTTIHTTQSNRATIADGASTGATTTIEVPAWADGEYLQVAVDQIGSATPGANLSVNVVYS